MGASNNKVMPRTLIITKKQLRDIKKMLRHNGGIKQHQGVTKSSIEKTLKDVGQRQEMLTTSGNTEVTPKVFNIVKNALEDIKNIYIYMVFYLRDIGQHQGMIGNTKKMPKTLKQHLGWSQGCQAMLTKYSEMWRIINININIFDNDDGTLGKDWSPLNNTSETLRDIEKTLKNIKHSWENSEECQLAPKTPSKL